MTAIDESITISDEEIPGAIRGPWKGMTILQNEMPLSIGGHSDSVADFIEAAKRRKDEGRGAKGASCTRSGNNSEQACLA